MRFHKNVFSLTRSRGVFDKNQYEKKFSLHQWIGPQRRKTCSLAVNYLVNISNDIIRFNLWDIQIVCHLLSASVYCSTCTNSKMGVKERLYLHVLGDVFLMHLLTDEV